MFSMLSLIVGLAAVASSTPAQAAPTPVRGSVTGFKVTNGDDIVDGGFVVPSIRAEKLITLQLDDMVAPNERLDAGPVTVNIPGNLVFPNQSENYLFFTVNLNKPNFNLPLEPGVSNELSAISFRGAFSQIADLAQNKAPLTRMLPLVKFGNQAFADSADWSTVPQPVALALNRVPTKTVAYSWQRPAAPSNAVDVVIGFQRTPAGRWLLSDFFAGSKATPANGQVASINGFQSEMKIAAARVFDSPQAEDQIPASVLAWLGSTTATGSVEFKNIPEPIRNASLQNNNSRVAWQPINAPGWMAVTRIVNGGVAQQDMPGNFSFALSLGLNRLASLFAVSAKPVTLVAWVNAADGVYDFPALIGSDNVILTFVGTDRAVPRPLVAVTPDSPEPEIFTYANEIRMQRIIR